jgi:hypothetical protein
MTDYLDDLDKLHAEATARPDLASFAYKRFERDDAREKIVKSYPRLAAELRALREVVEILGSLSVRANAFREHYERLLAAIAKAKAKEARGG